MILSGPLNIELPEKSRFLVFARDRHPNYICTFYTIKEKAEIKILAMEILIVIAIVMEQMLLPSRKILDEANLEIPALHV